MGTHIEWAHACNATPCVTDRETVNAEWAIDEPIDSDAVLTFESGCGALAIEGSIPQLRDVLNKALRALEAFEDAPTSGEMRGGHG